MRPWTPFALVCAAVCGLGVSLAQATDVPLSGSSIVLKDATSPTKRRVTFSGRSEERRVGKECRL